MTWLAIVHGRQTAMLATVVLLVVGSTLFLVQRSTEPAPAAAEVHVATFKNEAHAPAGDFTVELVTPLVTDRDRHFLGSGPGRPLLSGCGFAEEHTGHRPERLVQRRKDSRRVNQTPVERDVPATFPVRYGRGCGINGVAEKAMRAKPVGGIG